MKVADCPWYLKQCSHLFKTKLIITPIEVEFEIFVMTFWLLFNFWKKEADSVCDYEFF